MLVLLEDNGLAVAEVVWVAFITRERVCVVRCRVNQQRTVTNLSAS